MVIEGVVGNDTYGRIAIDDISMTPQCELSQDQSLPGDDTTTTPIPPGCPQDLLPCLTPGKCYHPTEACNFKDDCGDGTDEQGCSKYLYNSSFTSFWMFYNKW